MQDLAPLDEIERMRSLVGHELREPLAAIKGSAVTLLEEGAELGPAEMREFHRIIAEQARHMRDLIGDLLDTGCIESGTLSVVPEPSEVVALVERARSTFLGGGGRHAVLVDLPAGLAPVMVDRRRVVQVLHDLLANAARHAPESTPIRVGATREEASVAASVSDEGRRAAPERLLHLFSRNARAGQEATAGHGLGLAICRGSWRCAAAASGPPAPVPAAAPLLPSRFRRRAGPPAGRPAPPPIRRRPRKWAGRRASWWSTTTPGTLRFVCDALSCVGYAPLVTGEARDLPRIIRTSRRRKPCLAPLSRSGSANR